MKIISIIAPLVLGITGGLIAVFVSKGLESDESLLFFPTSTIDSELTKQVVNDPNRYGSVDLRYAAKKTVPAVVNITTVQMGQVYYGSPLDFWFGGSGGEIRDKPINMGIGSGVILTEDGYIITNNHVIESSDKIIITLNDKRKFEAELIGSDPNTDIALLKIDAKNLPAIKYGNSDNVVLGEWVLAVGNPYNLTSTVTAGIISAKARKLGGEMNLESFLQTDAAVNQGNSGGALVNIRGELIGINTAIQSPTGSYSGYSFAVPVNIARKVVSDLKEFGKVQRAMIGIRMRELTPTNAKKMGLKESAGIYIVEAVKEGAAEKAGIVAGDVILEINGYDVMTVAQLHGQLAKYTPGNTVRVLFSRGGREYVVDAVLQNIFGDTSLGTVRDTPILGVSVKPLTKEEQYQYHLNKGVKIYELKNGKLKTAGLSKGYIIVKINNITIYSQKDLDTAIKSAGNEGVLVSTVSPKGVVEYFAFSLLD